MKGGNCCTDALVPMPPWGQFSYMLQNEDDRSFGSHFFSLLFPFTPQ